MIGARLKGALYFIGFQNEELVLFDPHKVQVFLIKRSALDINDLWEKRSSYHCDNLLTIPFSKLDTSVGFAFYARNEIEFKEMIYDLKLEMKRPNSFIQILESRPKLNR